MRTRRSRGFVIISLLMALAIIGILSGMYMEKDPKTGKPWAQVQTDRARSTVCSANRRSLQANLVMAQIDGGPDAMRRAAQNMPPCPDGGRYFFFKDLVQCTGDPPTAPLFRDLFADRAR